MKHSATSNFASFGSGKSAPSTYIFDRINMFIFSNCNCENLSARLITVDNCIRTCFGVCFSDTSMHLYCGCLLLKTLRILQKWKSLRIFFLRSTEFEQIRIIVSVSVSTLIFCIYVTHTNWLVCVCVLGSTRTNTPYIQHTTHAN